MANLDDVNNILQPVYDAIASAEVAVGTVLDSKDAKILDLTTQLAAAKAAATPPPPAPSLFSVSLQNMAEVSPGSGVYRSLNLGGPKANGGQVAVVQARLHTPAQPGQTVLMKYDQTTNVVPNGKSNIKDWRVWPNPSTPYPNHWTGCGLGDNGNKITAENVNLAVLQRSSHPTGWTNGYFPFYIKPNVKQHFERTVRLSSAIGKGDGYVAIVVDGVTVFESDGFIVDGPAEDFGPQMVYAPLAGDSGTFPAGSYLQIENIAVTVK